MELTQNDIRDIRRLLIKVEEVKAELDAKKESLAASLGEFLRADEEGNVRVDAVEKFLGLNDSKRDKTILVMYLAVGGLNREEIDKQVKSLQEMIKPILDDVNLFIMPSKNLNDSRVECLNPRIVEDDEREKLNKLMESLEQSIKDVNALINKERALE